jgi:hypothetical protein
MAVSQAHVSCIAPINVQLGGVLLANMLEGWLEGDRSLSATTEGADELNIHRLKAVG